MNQQRGQLSQVQRASKENALQRMARKANSRKEKQEDGKYDQA